MSGEPFALVVVGHVDHGKSTLIGRLLADTGSLPRGKLEQVRNFCEKNARPFEYAFLLDALKNEQEQGITIDTARIFFKTGTREYLILDAPGHIEFLKNMISGAARAEGALLLIDANEGVKENSRRHGYMLSLLGIEQVVVCVNKMDLVGYDQKIFEQVKEEYEGFLESIGMKPLDFIPISAFKGDNVAKRSDNLLWFNGNTVLEALDHFQKTTPLNKKPLRMPIQDVYKFTAMGDNRRIIVGRIESGTLKTGDEILLLPSGKTSKVKTIEEFKRPKTHPEGKVVAGFSTGFTLEEQIYVRRGEIVCKKNEPLPRVSNAFRANIFWMSKKPFTIDKEYKIKIGTAESLFKLRRIEKVLDTSNLNVNSSKSRIDRHEVAECVLECLNPLAFDLAAELQHTSRFVIVDEYDISGGGIIVESMDNHLNVQKQLREEHWDRGLVSFEERAERYAQRPLLVMITGRTGIDKKSIAWQLEKQLFTLGKKVYFLGIRNILRGLDADLPEKRTGEHIRRLGEVANLMVDAGLIVIATASDLSEKEFKLLKSIVDETIIVVVDGEENLADFTLDSEPGAVENAKKIIEFLRFKELMFVFGGKNG